MLNKIKKTCIVILASALIIIPLSFSNGCRKKTTKKSTKISQKKRQKNIEDLYKEALADVKEEKYASAVNKLNQALKDDPNNKKVQAKLKEVKTLAKKKGIDIAAGTTPTDGSTSNSQNTTSTGSTTTTDTSTSTQTGSTGSSTNNTSTGNNSSTSNNTSSNNSSSTQTDEEEKSKLIDIPAGATPLSILPEGLTGYSTATSGWLAEPTQAQGRYAPTDAKIRKEVETVLVTAAKFEREAIAKAHYEQEKELFPKDPKTVEVNGHNAYFGTYAESKPDLFPPTSTFVWVRGEWAFAVRIIPADMISAKRLREISTELAEQFKY